MDIQTEYLRRVLDPSLFVPAIKKAKAMTRKVKFDAIAVTGNSGTIFGGAFSAFISKPLILIRKENDSSHSPFTLEGDCHIKSYIFVDDFKATGTTKRRVKDLMEKELPEAEFVGSYYYFYECYEPEMTWPES